MELVKFIKGLAICFALTVGLAQSASAAWNAPTVSVAQVQLEMKSCGLLDGDVREIYSRCLAINAPPYHGWNWSRWNSRGTLCWKLAKQYSDQFWYQDNVVHQTWTEVDRKVNCITDAYQVTLDSIRTEAVPDACAEGTVLNANGTQCVPAYDCFLGGMCSEAAKWGVFSGDDGNIYAGDTHENTGCPVQEPYDAFHVGTKLVKSSYLKLIAKHICR